jgi:HD-like signal output (HDOD) protein
MAVLWDGGASVRDFLSIIEGDPALTASVLRAANSSFAAPTGPIRTAAQALDRIGVDAAHQIVSAAFARSEFENLTRSDVHFDDYWSWQLAVALLSECFALADRRPADEIESAFTIGLIHQVGRLALIAHSPERYREVVKLAITGVEPQEAEWQILGDYATHVTALVGSHWGFFDPLPATLTALGNPEVSGLAAIVREARSVAAQLGFTEGFSLTVPVAAPLPPTHPRHAALAAIGGLDELTRQIQWFRRASGGRTPLTLTTGADQLEPPAQPLAS